jgi:hypothetical protein
MGRGHLSPDVVQPCHGLSNVARLSERRDFNDQSVILAGQLESRQQIRDLPANFGVDILLPAFGSRE